MLGPLTKARGWMRCGEWLNYHILASFAHPSQILAPEEDVLTMDKKIGFFNRFFGEKSVFGGAGKDFRVEKSEVKKSAKNRRFFR